MTDRTAPETPTTRQAWLRKYPNHCTTCEARTNSEYPCQNCLGRMLCPRCMSSETLHEYDASIPCTACGWVESEDHAHGAPLSRKERKYRKREAAAQEARDRERRIQDARKTLKELGAE